MYNHIPYLIILLVLFIILMAISIGYKLAYQQHMILGLKPKRYWNIIMLSSLALGIAMLILFIAAVLEKLS